MRRGLYAIVDPERAGGRDPITIAEAILRGGCAVIQLRAKSMGDRDRLALARAIAERARARSVPFVMNDRPDLALLAGADMLHLGQHDLSIVEARKIVGDMPIGRSTHDVEQARAAASEGASIIGLGPVFPTRSKEDPDPIVGTAMLAEVVRTIGARIAIVAIGGISMSNAHEVRATGASLGAAISALGEAADPEAAARDLHRTLGGA